MADNVLGIAGVVDIDDIQKTFDELIGKLESVGIKTNELSGKMTKALNDISASNADMATKQKQSLEVLKSGLEQAKNAIMQYPEKLREAKNEVENTERAITKLEGELSKLRGELNNQVVGSKGFDELQGKIAGVEAQLSNNRQSLQQHTATLENLQGAYQNVITLYGTASAAVGANASTHALNAVSVGLEAVQHTANTAEIGKETQAINESNAAKQQQMKSANESVQMLSAEAEAIERVIAKFNEGKVSESEYASVIGDGTRFIEEREKQLLSLREEMRKQMEIASTTKYDKDYNVTNQGEIDAATKAYEEYSAKVNELDKALSQLREKLRELQGAHDSVAQKQKEQEQATQQVADNEKKATSAYEQSKQKVDELQAKLDELKQKKEDILRVGNSDFFIPQVPADMLANSGNTFGSETLENLRSVNAEIRQTEAELSNAKDKVAEMNEQLQQARQATAAQNAEASRANDPFGVQGSSAKELKERIAECKNTLESLNAEADKLANKDNLTKKQQEQFAELNKKIRETRQEQEACQQQLDAITPTWQKVIEKIKGYGSSLGDAMTGHGKFQQSLGQMGNAFGSLGAPIKGAIGGVVSMTKALWAMCATPIGAIISAVVIGLQALTTWFRKSAEGQRAFSVISAFVGSILSSLTDILVKVGKYLFHAFADASGPMNAFANGLVTTLKSAVKTASDLLSGLGDMVRGVVQAFQGDFEAAWEYIKNGGLKIANGLGGALNTVANAFTTTLQGVWGTMKMIGNGAQEAFNANLAGGLGDMMNKARQAAQLAKQEHDNTIAMADAREHALELEKQIAANKEKIYTLSGKEKDALIEQTKLLEKQKYEGWTDDNGVQHKGILQTQREALSIAEQQHSLHAKSLEQIKQERELRMQILTTEKEQAASTRMLTRQQEANRKAMENAEKQKLKQGTKQTAAVNKANAKLDETVYTNENARIKAEQDLEDKIALAKIQAMQRGFERTQAEREREAKNELEKIEQQHKEALEAERKRQKAEHDAQQEIIKARGGKVVEWDNSMFDTNTDAVKKINELYSQWKDAVRTKQMQDERDWIDSQRQTMLDYLKEYGTFEEKKLAISKEYADKIRKAQTNGEKLSLQQEFSVKMNELDSQKILQGLDMASIFSDFGLILTEPLKESIEQLRKLTETKAFKNRSFEEQKTVFDAIEKAEKALGGLNGLDFSGIANSVVEYNAALADRARLERELADAAERLANADTKLTKARLTGNDATVQLAQAEYNEAESKYNLLKNDYAAANAKVAQTQAAASSSLEKFNNTLNKVDSSVKAIYNGSLKGIWDLLGRGVQDRIGGLVSGGLQLQHQFDNLVATLTKSGVGLDNFATQMQDKLGEVFATFTDETTLDTAKDAVNKMIEGVFKESLGDDGKFDKVSSQFGKLIGDLLEQGTKKGATASDTAQSIGQTIGELLKSIGKAGEASGNLWGAIIGIILQLLDEFAENGLGRFIETLLSKVGEAISGILGKIFQDLIPSLGRGIGQLVAGVVEGVVNLVSAGAAGSFLTGKDHEEEYKNGLQDWENKIEANTYALEQLTKAMTDKTKTPQEAQKERDAARAALQGQIASLRGTANYVADDSSSNLFSGYHSWYWKRNDEWFDYNRFNNVLAQHGSNTRVRSSQDVVNLSADDIQILRTYAGEAWADYFGSVDSERDPNEVKKYLEEIGDLAEKDQEIMDDWYAALTNMTFDALRDNFKSNLMDMSKDREDFLKDFSEDMMDSMLDTMMSTSGLSQRLKEWQQKWGEYIASGNELSEDEIRQLREEYQKLIDEGIAMRDKAAKATGYGEDEAYQQKGSTGAWESLGEDTGKELNGRFTALQITGESILVQTIEQTTILTDIQEGMILTQGMISEISSNIGRMIEAQNTANDHLEAISRNTYQLYEMRDDIKEIVKKVKNV